MNKYDNIHVTITTLCFSGPGAPILYLTIMGGARFVSVTPQGLDVGRDTAVGRVETGAGPGAKQVEKTGRIDEEAGRRNEAHRRAAVSDDTQTGGRPAEVRRESYRHLPGEQ